MKNNFITECRAKAVLDSRGNPTLEVTLSAGELLAQTLVPSGKSTGKHEAKELRDSDNRGVSFAVERIEKIITPTIIGREVDQKKIDNLMISLDGTKDKSYLGGNSMIGISFAVAQLSALQKGIPLWKHIALDFGVEPSLPKLFMNMINGGVHADFVLPFQEYIVVIDKKSPRLAYEVGKEIFSKLGKLINSEFGKVKMGDEGGYSPDVSDIQRPFEILTNVIPDEEDTFLAVDAAASELLQNDSYILKGQSFTASELAGLYSELIKNFPLKSIEDPFAEDNTDDFTKLVAKEGNDILVVGDDLTVTNPERITTMIEKKAANAVIIKPNQIGTMTETYEAIRLARQAGWKIIVSHRSGDTMSTFISDLAVGVSAYGLKAGSPNPSERRVKYERLIEIAEKEMIK